MVDTEGAENIVVVLGTPTPDSTKLYAQTVIEGDPSWAGVLAGVAMHLPTYHILESEVKSLVDPKVYEETIGASEFALDGETICQAVREVREANGVTA